MGVVAHGPIHKFHKASSPLKLLNEEHLMYIITSKPIRGRDDDAIKGRASYLLSQSIKTWSAQLGPAVSIITEDMLLLPGPTLGLMIGSQPVELLFDGVGLCLSVGRNADVDRDVHSDSPGNSIPGESEGLALHSIEAVVGRLDPIASGHQVSQWWSVEGSTVVFSWMSTFGQHISSVASEGYCISGGKPFRADILGRCLIWLRQNLSFVIIPLRIACIGDGM